MAINRKKAKRQRRRASEQFKARGERQLLQRIEAALMPPPHWVFPGDGTMTGRASSSQLNAQNIQRTSRQRIIDQAALYQSQFKEQQRL